MRGLAVMALGSRRAGLAVSGAVSSVVAGRPWSAGRCSRGRGRVGAHEVPLAGAHAMGPVRCLAGSAYAFQRGAGSACRTQAEVRLAGRQCDGSGVYRQFLGGADATGSTDWDRARGRYPIAFRGHRRRPPRQRVHCGPGGCHAKRNVATRRRPSRATACRPRQLGGLARPELAGIEP